MKKLEGKILTLFLCAAVVLTGAGVGMTQSAKQVIAAGETTEKETTEKDYIKWVSFTPNVRALRDTLALDIETYGTERHLPWSTTLAYLTCKNGGKFRNYKKSQLVSMLDALGESGTPDDLMKESKYYSFYKEAYSAVLSGLVGEYTKLAPDKESKTGYKIVEGYGLKAYSPIAEGFWWNHYDDFGDSREYGFKRKHLGNDLMGAIGTPIVSIEGGTVEMLGWNRYGGWRIGIRSFDGKRSYYYAHLRRNRPYAEGLKIGTQVKAGQVIGYLGMTGYSYKENVNGMDIPHLHLGMQLIFDESQKEGNNQIWIDLYALVELLSSNRATVMKTENSEYKRVYDIIEPIYPESLRHIVTVSSKVAETSTTETSSAMTTVAAKTTAAKNPID